jgi:hypothetical protein
MSIKLMNEVWMREDLNATQKIVMLALSDWANDEGLCWPSIDRLGQKTSMAGRSVQRIIRELENMGFVKRDEVIGRGNRYWILAPLTECHPRHSVTPPLTQCHPTPDTVSPNTSMIHQGNTSKSAKPKKPAQEPPPKTGPFQDAINAQSQQGRARLNRPKAWAAWQRLSKVHGEDKLLAAYKRYLSTDKDAQRDNGDWQAGLQVWLNQKADLWIEQHKQATAAPTLLMVRRWVEGAILAPTSGFDEWKAGMTFQEAKDLVAAAEADGRLTPRPKITEQVF